MKTQTNNASLSPHSDLTDSNLTDSEAIRSLASLSPLDYDRTRKEAARSLRVRVETLDAEVSRLRNQIREDAMLRSALSTLNSPQPSTDPVNDGADLLTQILERFRHYLFLPPGAAEAFTLWSGQVQPGPARSNQMFFRSPPLKI